MKVTGSVASHVPKTMCLPGTNMNIPGTNPKYGFLNIQITVKLPTMKKNRRNKHLLGSKEESTEVMKEVNEGRCGNLAML